MNFSFFYEYLGDQKIKVSEMAKILGVSRQFSYVLIQKYKIRLEDGRVQVSDSLRKLFRDYKKQEELKKALDLPDLSTIADKKSLIDSISKKLQADQIALSDKKDKQKAASLHKQVTAMGRKKNIEEWLVSMEREIETGIIEAEDDKIKLEYRKLKLAFLSKFSHKFEIETANFDAKNFFRSMYEGTTAKKKEVVPGDTNPNN